MRFDLVDLRLFVNVCDAGSIAAGAVRSHLAAQSASDRVLAMEGALGAPLLVRDRRGARPTEAGQTLLRHARVILRQAEHMVGELSAHAEGLRTHVRLLCNAAAMAEYLPEALGAFLREQPGVSLDVETRTSADIVRAVREGQADLGLLASSADMAGLACRAVREDALQALVPRGHALAARAEVSLADLAATDLVGLERDNPLQAHIDAQAAKAGHRVAYRVRLGSFDAVSRMVAADIGLAIVPRSAASRAQAAWPVTAIALAEPWAQRWLVACARDFSALPPLTCALADALASPDEAEPPG